MRGTLLAFFVWILLAFSPKVFAANSIAVSSGDAQSQIVAGPLPNPLQVVVTDALLAPVSGIKVNWSVVTVGGGTLSAASSLTDGSGIAQINLTLGGTVGAKTIKATINGTTTSVTFTETAVAATLAVSSGNNQSQILTAPLTNPLKVLVTDPGTAPVAGVKVNWTVVTASGGTLSASSSLTDGSGVAQINFTMGATVGAKTIKATINGSTTSVNFTATGTTPNLSISSGNSQSQAITTVLANPLKVLVTDPGTNPVAGVKINWTVVTASGGTLSAASSFTDASGFAQTIFTLGSTAGAKTVKATINGLTANQNFIETATAVSITGNAGAGQSKTVNQTLDNPLQVTVTDGLSNPVEGVKITWSVIAGGGNLSTASSLTDASGVAETNLTVGKLVGTNTVKAVIYGTTPSVSISDTAVADAPASIVISGGNSQSQGTTLDYPSPLKVTVKDQFTNLVPNATIDWAVTQGLGSPASPSTMTNASGVAQVIYTAGTTSIVEKITATVHGTGLSVLFSETTHPGPAAIIQVVSGDQQAKSVGQALTLPLKVLVTDAYANPFSGTTVAWKVISGGGTLSAPTSLTSAAGLAQINYTLSTIAGPKVIRATINGTTVFTSFNEIALAGAPIKIAIVSGNTQTKLNDTLLDNPLVVNLKDAYNNLVPNANITWSVAKGNGSVTNAFSATNANGLAQITFKTGKLAGLNQIKAAITKLPTTFVTFNAAGLVGPAASVTVVSGNHQTRTVGQLLPLPMKAIVKDANGNPCPGVDLNWYDYNTFVGPTVTTDSKGVGTLNVALSTVAGENQLIAYVTVPNFFYDYFYEVGTPAAPANITVVAGNTQTGGVGLPLAQPLETIVRDAWFNPIPKVPVTWQVTAGGATLSSLTGVTDAFGISQPSMILGPVPGVHTAKATITGTAINTTFSETALPLIQSVSPNIESPSNKPVTILGAGFAAGATINFPGATCTYVSTTQFNCVTGPHGLASVNVNVTANGLTSTNSPFLYSHWKPTDITDAPAARTGHLALWTGSKMLIWGGCGGIYSQSVLGEEADATCGLTLLNDGATYDPNLDLWTAMSTTNAPAGRVNTVSAWTGTKLIVWGGRDSSNYFTDGAIFDPAVGANGTWTTTLTTNAPISRRKAGAVWDTIHNKMLVYGGMEHDVGDTLVNTGVKYNPLTGWETAVWGTATATTANNLSARQNPNMFWDATHASAIIWGGDDSAGNPFMDGVIYNATQDRLTPMAAFPLADRLVPQVEWTGSQLIVFGGRDLTNTSYINDGAIFDPATNTWTTMAATIGGYTPRQFGYSAWLNEFSSLLLFGGTTGGGNFFVDDFVAYQPPVVDTWAIFAGEQAYGPASRPALTYGPYAFPISTGSRVIVWGGVSTGGTVLQTTGGIFTP